MKKEKILIVLAFYILSIIAITLTLNLVEKNKQKDIFDVSASGYTNVYDLKDGSWFILDRKNNEYVFQAVELGDWDITLNNEEGLGKILATYFINKYNVEENTAIEKANEILKNIK